MIGETINDKLDGMREDINALTMAVGSLVEQFRILAEHNRKLIEILMPAQKDDGPSLAVAMARLTDEVGNMAELTGVVVTYIRDMPGMVTESVLEGTGGLKTAIQDLPGRVMTAVKDVI